MLLTAPPSIPAELPRQGAHSGSNSKQEWQTRRSHRPALLSSPASADQEQSSCYNFKGILGAMSKLPWQRRSWVQRRRSSPCSAP